MPDTLAGRLMLKLQWAVAGLSYGLTNYRHPLRLPSIAASRDARRMAGVGATPLECVELFNAVTACEKLPGDMAEAGVYRGGSAAVMLAASRLKRLHLFDTFEGLPHAEAGFSAGTISRSGRIELFCTRACSRIARSALNRCGSRSCIWTSTSMTALQPRWSGSGRASVPVGFYCLTITR